MKLGNTKQVIFLSFAAIAAIAFFIIRLLPGGASAIAMNSAAAGPVATRPTASLGLPTEVLRDAFSHPALTKRYLDSIPLEKRHTDSEALSIERLVGPLPVPLKGLMGVLPEATATGDKPSENAGMARQQDGRPKSKISLKAIMRTTKPLALVTIDDREDVTVGLGEFIDTTYRITQFSENAIQITSDIDKEWLYVGHEVTEK